MKSMRIIIVIAEIEPFSLIAIWLSFRSSRDRVATIFLYVYVHASLRHLVSDIPFPASFFFFFLSIMETLACNFKCVYIYRIHSHLGRVKENVYSEKDDLWLGPVFFLLSLSLSDVVQWIYDDNESSSILMINSFCCIE